MTLTTPVLKDEDSVFPGEGFFYYFKTSASLWREKLEGLSGGQNLFVPINWSFHSETGEDYDFGEKRPETDLSRLNELAKELGLRVIFLLPLTPVPYLPNGGVPHLLARNLAKSKQNIAKTVFDSDGNLNKIYSFYDSRIFKCFTQFVHELGENFSRTGISAALWGMEGGYFEKGEFVSYFEDCSTVFDKGFSKFLQASNLSAESVEEEKQFKKSFSDMIQGVYQETIEKSLEENFEGTKKICFLGGSEKDFFLRYNKNDSASGHSRKLLSCLRHDYIPSTVLLDRNLKKGAFGKLIQDQLSFQFLDKKYSEGFIGDDDTSSYHPFFYFLVSSKFQKNSSSLLDYLNNFYKNCFHFFSEDEFLFNEEEDYNEQIIIFSGESLEMKSFQQMIRVFMQGGKVLLDSAGLGEDLKKRLELFFLENSLDVEKVNFYTLVEKVTLGGGELLVFNSSELKGSESACFWEKLIGTFDFLKHIRVMKDDGVLFSWQTRAPSTGELKFEQIRRLGLYNPSSYKKKVRIGLDSHFALIRLVDEINTKNSIQSKEVEVELSPDGSISLDIGVF